MEFIHLKLLSFFIEQFATPKDDTSTEKSWRVKSHAASVYTLFCIFLFVLLCAVWFLPKPLAAQETSTSEITIDEINMVARELWCPLCSGVRLDVCELQACDQMREQIGIQLANDASVEEIKTYFIEQYGPQVMGEPPRSGFNWLAWIVPVVALAAGALLLLRRGRTMFSSSGAIENGTIDDAAIDFALGVDKNERDRRNADNELGALPKGDDQLHNSLAEGQVDAPNDQYADALEKELNAYE